ncbi:NADH-quinone oxidoreductase subunit C [Flavobacterium columnare NBRC 100251 = ATCC 23463]|uniref:NADH-quinone oxidoreductase subunit C n=1 Tax=Flavobacterium columnare TaxID=996 RepID=UPI0007F9E3EC|nr:NADH-quinone oxidoreductase subunit C [Flavobacterium columnare]ANO49405.1 NADH dehydrogenase I, C subunit [Flavobacterium columnare]APT22628.1 NADH dehydrogenase [Flavobacterium columnare]MBF6651771.1 NADH-quinone oxidoreductase subunit C [Flavobacterium columnare]MBF6654250.1 NADH-quinone oxidoreductase subunit C [Flavobacterium columnare]MBF6656802.1 NADH-quinone oxidoreductase subunit C [Flavobacterium columnare]
MALENAVIQQKLIDQFGLKVSEFVQLHDILTFEVASDAIVEVMKFLKEDATLRFNFLTDLCGVHYPEYEANRQLGVVYHMHNWIDGVRIRIKCFLPIDNPEIDSVTSLFLGANWQERETFDFYGITFKGHPQLKRILNMDEMTVFPMRKEFPLEDGGRTDKDDRFFGRTTHNC